MNQALHPAITRWASIGPYYAMFPVPFAFDVVTRHCPPGGAILDPFAGRGSSAYAAAATGRYAYAIDINAVGWLYTHTKLHPAPEHDVLARHAAISQYARRVTDAELDALPDFFHHCYTRPVLRYLLAARQSLHWRTNPADSTLMAIILIYLHGAKEKSLSNQLRQTKAMAPDYSIRWWRARNLTPPNVQPDPFITQRIRWRYAYGTPTLHPATARLGNSIHELDRLEHEVTAGNAPPFDLLFTSPPYYNITSYHYDQWLRLWMLGGSAHPSKTGGDWQDGFWSQSEYRALLETVFSKCARILKPNATLWVRTDSRPFTRDVTIHTLSAIFPNKTLHIIHSHAGRSQTALFGDHSPKPGELDLILTAQH